jgi:glutathione S-transferase
VITQTDARALIRLACDHVNRTLVPAFYRYLQAQDVDAQVAGGKEFHEAIEKLVGALERAERELPADEREGLGLWSTDELGLVDVMVGPCKSPRP